MALQSLRIRFIYFILLNTVCIFGYPVQRKGQIKHGQRIWLLSNSLGNADYLLERIKITSKTFIWFHFLASLNCVCILSYFRINSLKESSWSPRGNLLLTCLHTLIWNKALYISKLSDACGSFEGQTEEPP